MSELREPLVDLEIARAHRQRFGVRVRGVAVLVQRIRVVAALRTRAAARDGRFFVHGLREGPHLLKIAADGFRPIDRDDIAAGTTDLVIELQPRGRAGVVVHVVRSESDGFLNRLVEASGGRQWSAGSDRQLRELFTRALEEMRARYLLSYTPAGSSSPGWHEVKVKLKNQRGDITARPGYFVAK